MIKLADSSIREEGPRRHHHLLELDTLLGSRSDAHAQERWPFSNACAKWSVWW